MAHIDRHEIEEYPFTGEFYTSMVDMTVPLEEREETEVVVLRSECDITEASHERYGGFVSAVYSVYVPFDKGVPIPVKRGMLFRSDDYGVLVAGKVAGVFPSQLGGFTAYIEVNDV